MKVIACESATLTFNVKKRTWIKSKSYSILADDSLIGSLSVGGLYTKHFLSALSYHLWHGTAMHVRIPNESFSLIIISVLLVVSDQLLIGSFRRKHLHFLFLGHSLDKALGGYHGQHTG